MKLSVQPFYLNSARNLFAVFTLQMGIQLLNNIWLKGHDLLSQNNQFAISGLISGIVFTLVKNEVYHVISFFFGSVFFAFYVYSIGVQ